MNTIIAGRFDEQTEVDQTVNDLHRAGFDVDQIDTFFVNPPGQHDTFPVGGDQDESAGATHADATAVGGIGVGAIVGIGAGLAAAPFIGPAAIAVGAGVGAYTGSLAGALGGMDDPHKLEDDTAVPQSRHAGLIVAVHTPDEGTESQAIAVLRARGAKDIERAEGKWVAGSWSDFDPLLPARLVGIKTTEDADSSIGVGRTQSRLVQ
ncbi:MAG: hypothetical protein H0T80_21440 [Betaproteobacteria bacterium]|nr:hypothetical protein [Betaproteobacteria bacterium]MBA3777369.1 hypothetical protein [Betaproteobacteria bacterium]